MATEDWEHVQDVFDRVLSAPASDRPAILDDLCGNSSALRAEVESLIEHATRAGDQFLATPMATPHSEESLLPRWALAFVGRKIGHYQITRLLGHGGMGCVFEAQQERPARPVALKVVQPGFGSPSALARFRLEPEMLGRLQHPNIGQIFEAGVHEYEHGALPYFAMEFVPNARTLTEYADALNLTVRHRLDLFAKVCDAVHHGHQKGIVHRDLKPGNILVGDSGEPKVIDFGVARVTDSDVTKTTSFTHAGDLLGTLRYMSPEQCDGNSNLIDTRSDIYSLGVVLYELLTGTAPYDTSGTTVYATLRVIKEALPRRPSEVSHVLRGDIDAIILKALEKEPARRYGSAADLARDIRRHLAGEPIEARRPGSWRRALLWAGRRPRAAAAISAVAFFGLSALLTVASARVYVWYYFQQPVAMIPDNADPVPKVSVLNRNGTPVHEWEAGAGGMARGYLVQPIHEDPERKLALVSFSTASLPDRACELRAYDLRGDLNRPLWQHRLRAQDIPRSLATSGIRADQFSPADIWAFDIFPETQSPQIAEIVCQFPHNTYSFRELCVFRATDGELLYRVWHDGSFRCHWLAGPKLLLGAGENWEKFPRDRGCSKESPTARMMVVFALRPSLKAGVLEPRLINTPQLPVGGELAWYKWLSVCPIPRIDWEWQVSSPPDGDASAVAELALKIKTEPPCLVLWRIDANGDQIAGTLTGPTYRMASFADPSFPPLEEFGLQDTPPGY